jgi:hypothetical protein
MEGSDYFAHYPTVPKESTVADINIDGAPGLVFYGSNKLTAIGAEHSSLNENAGRAAQRTGTTWNSPSTLRPGPRRQR